MPSNSTDNSTTEQTSQPSSAGRSEPADVEAARRAEDSKLTRRAALRKLGYGAGVAAFSLLGVDDLARLVGQRLNRMAGDSKVAQAVAKEFQQAGIALAGPPPNGCIYVQGPGGSGAHPGTGECNVNAIGSGCAQAHPNDTVACGKCVQIDCHICACGDATGVPCNDPACNSYCYSTAVSSCSIPSSGQ